MMMLIVLGLPVAVMMIKLGSFYVCVFPLEKRVAAAAVAVAAAKHRSLKRHDEASGETREICKTR